MLIFPDDGCIGFPKRFFWNDESDKATYYNIEDIEQQDLDGYFYAKSVLVPFGYDLTLFTEQDWRGSEKTITGLLKNDATGVGSLKCQKVSTGQAKSIRIDKHKQGKSTGYWKGITASDD